MTPVYIGGCYGVLHAAAGRRGVVICPPLGEEALNAYRAQLFLAETLADAGFPTLRLSYYGTGDSAGEDDEPDRFQAWIDSIVTAVRWMRSSCGVTSVSLCGVRIGAALAALAASELGDVDDLILLVPVASGRRFLREQILTARTVAEIWQANSPIDDGRWFEAYGLRLDMATRDRLDHLDIGKLGKIAVQRILLLDQPNAPANDRLADKLRGQGIDVTHEIGDCCDVLLRDSHEVEVPHSAFARVVAWLGDAGRSDRSASDIGPEYLDVGTVRESPVRFGPDDALAGILAVPPCRDPASPVVLIASTGGNPRFGNSRGTVNLARWLAKQGIANLRMDGHGIGDAAPATGEHAMPYSKQGDHDVSTGVDFLAARYSGPIVVLGMCSGAYHAFQAALNDKRINGLMLLNLQKFVWTGEASLSVVQRTTFRTTGFYLRNITNPDVWRRLIRGQVNVTGIASTLAIRAARQAIAAAEPAMAAVRGESFVGMVRRQMTELAQRSVQILFVLSGNDPGLDEVSEYFGLRGWRLRRMRNVMFRTLRDADHTLNAHWARQSLQQAIGVYLRQRYKMAIQTRQTDDRPAFHIQPTPILVAAVPQQSTVRGTVIDSASTAA